MANGRVFRHSTQLFRHYIPTEYFLLAVIEFLFLVLSLYLGLETRFLGDAWKANIGTFFPKAILYASVMLLSLIAFGLYQKQAARILEVMILRVTAALLLGLIPLAASYYFAPLFFLGRGVLLLTFGYSFVFILLVRLVFFYVVKSLDLLPRVLVLGAGKRASLIRNSMDSGEVVGLNIIGYVALPGDEQDPTQSDNIALNAPLSDFVEENHVDEIVLAVDDRRAGLPTADLVHCRMSGIEILDLSTFFERRTGKILLEVLNPSWLYLSEGFRESLFSCVTKRGFDIAAVLLLLPIALPVMLLAAVLILLDSGGPVLYRQARVGCRGKLFQMYKLRSMIPNAEQDGVARWAAEDDARITRSGAILRRGRLDELPQLFNILKGDMSFVGPRPERPEFVSQLAESLPYYCERHRVKPGLTGWAQIRYPYGDSEEDAREKLQYDLYYVKNYNMLLDLLILLQTAEVVLLGEGAQ
ncbi:MAG: TIGR03013 family PEP-CTERM/XrtA system glycosyltransferase [Gammaproteobacteria bacterium]|jgi:sugar transferase (PEP-CTERM system associated)